MYKLAEWENAKRIIILINYKSNLWSLYSIVLGFWNEANIKV